MVGKTITDTADSTQTDLELLKPQEEPYESVAAAGSTHTDEEEEACLPDMELMMETV